VRERPLALRIFVGCFEISRSTAESNFPRSSFIVTVRPISLPSQPTMVHRALAPGFASISWWTPDSVGPLGDLLLEALGDALRDVGALHGVGAAADEGGGRDERDGVGARRGVRWLNVSPR
jgi:hypothetical protein